MQSRVRLGVAVAAFSTVGCGNFINNFTVNSTAPVLKRAAKSFDAEPDVQLAREAAPGNLKTIDGFLAAKPDQPILLELVAQGYTQYAFGFLEDDLESMKADAPERAVMLARATDIYDRAHAVAVRLLETEHDNFHESEKELGKLDTALKDCDDDDVAGLYWAGLSLASAINLHRDDINRVSDLPKAVALLERAHTVDPTYFNHGAAMALGVVYASQGAAVGGNPARAKEMFDEVMHATGGKYLLAKVLFARFYATVTADRALFEATLKEVLATPSDVMPEQRLANELAHKRAARYLAQVEDLF